MTYKVAILMGSPNDREKMQPAADMLERFGIEADVRVHSAHRTPAKVAELASTAARTGYSAFICGAGMAAHLAGAVAAHTTLPVVGVPISSGALNGVDALYATVQMPRASRSPPSPSTAPRTPPCSSCRCSRSPTPTWPQQLADHRTEIAG